MKYGYARVSTDDQNPALPKLTHQQLAHARKLLNESEQGGTVANTLHVARSTL